MKKTVIKNTENGKVYRKLDHRDHILLAPEMYIGGVSNIEVPDFYFTENSESIRYFPKTINPGLIKIINEILDNSIDEHITSNYEFSTKISVNIGDTDIKIMDNGRGIPVQKENGVYIPEMCWGEPMAGSNFDKKEEDSQGGTYGIGSYATAVFSKKFTGISDDGKKALKVTIENNAETIKSRIIKSTKSGVTVHFWPDLERFDLTKIPENVKEVIYQRLLDLNYLFPNITFSYNNKIIRGGISNSFKKYVSLFSEKELYDVLESENVKIGIAINTDDTYRHYSYVNNLRISKGGTIVNYVTDKIVNYIRDSLRKKYKNIKPGDIRNRIILIGFFGDFGKPKWSSQTKEELSNPNSEILKYLQKNGINDDVIKGFVDKLLKNKKLVNELTEIYRLKEAKKTNSELSKLKRQRYSEKYLPAFGKKKYLLICEGRSAKGGLLPILKRDGIGYYELGGKIINTYEMSESKFVSTKQQAPKELFKIINTEDYEYIITATDADKDGVHITGLVMVFMQRFFPQYLKENRFGRLRTPIITISKLKSKKPIRWIYDLSESLKLKKDERSHYKKGLGSWKPEELKTVINTEGFENMIQIFDFPEDEKMIKEYMEAWFGKDSEFRKEKLYQSRFDISME